MVDNTTNREFLFQIGSIKRVQRAKLHWQIFYVFLFQIGSIKSYVHPSFHVQYSSFLFQIGSIKRNLLLKKWDAFLVSIPNWFD